MDCGHSLWLPSTLQNSDNIKKGTNYFRSLQCFSRPQEECDKYLWKCSLFKQQFKLISPSLSSLQIYIYMHLYLYILKLILLLRVLRYPPITCLYPTPPALIPPHLHASIVCIHGLCIYSYVIWLISSALSPTIPLI